ncbi:MAG: hypothetical protein LPK45_01380, partial [Bacteroidota bacterium]|nr:hypothetical protein [Bacteroidota bacterium]MDX5429684.1 hypothetical protein [Bacteroidota bacterium]MDX5468465.1 hypothetical protein [Bacteroidota bacterium]
MAFVKKARAQCDPTVPTFYVDLSGNADSFWTSVDTIRLDNCCGTSNPDRCIRFIVTLDSGAIGINFDFYSGAVPPGALFYQISCGGSYAVGNDICLSGVGPHEITFCKPGNNKNVYSIKSIPAPAVSDPIIVSQACVDTIYATSLVESSITWRSVPSNATYDSYLSDTAAEDTVVVIPTGSFPNFVDYEVCGTVVGSCGAVNFCDTVRVTFVSNFTVTILPDDPTICFGGAPAQIYAVGSGGSTPYSYLWSTGSTNDTISVNLGSYWVQATDSLGCTPVYDTVQVDSFSVDIVADAGNDTLLCLNNQQINLQGSVTGVSTGQWSGGGGTFSPSADSLNITYIPGPADLVLGQANLSLITTNTSGCPPDTSTIRVTFSANPTPSIDGSDTVCQNDSRIYSNPNQGTDHVDWQVTGGVLLSGPNDNPVTIQWDD